MTLDSWGSMDEEFLNWSGKKALYSLKLALQKWEMESTKFPTIRYHTISEAEKLERDLTCSATEDSLEAFNLASAGSPAFDLRLMGLAWLVSPDGKVEIGKIVVVWRGVWVLAFAIRVSDFFPPDNQQRVLSNLLREAGSYQPNLDCLQESRKVQTWNLFLSFLELLENL